MGAVARLLTSADVHDVRDDPGDPHRVSVSVLHEALLVDGRRIPLLDQRGWSSLRHGPTDEDLGDAWAVSSLEDLEETARMVVGPEEPFGDHTREDMETLHWAALADVLRRQGVDVQPHELRELPHEVVLSERLRARVSRDAADSSGESA